MKLEERSDEVRSVEVRSIEVRSPSRASIQNKYNRKHNYCKIIIQTKTMRGSRGGDKGTGPGIFKVYCKLSFLHWHCSQINSVHPLSTKLWTPFGQWKKQCQYLVTLPVLKKHHSTTSNYQNCANSPEKFVHGFHSKREDPPQTISKIFYLKWPNIRSKVKNLYQHQLVHNHPTINCPS